MTAVATHSAEQTPRDHFDHLARTGYWANLYTEHTNPRIRWSFLRRQAILEEWLDRVLQPGALVVEIGPGTGNLIPFLASRRCRYRGFDVAESMVTATRAQIAKSFAPDADARCDRGDIYQIPMEAHAADVVVAAGVLEYLEDPHRAAAELARITLPGATALISVPNSASLNRKLSRALSFLTTASRAARTLVNRSAKSPDVARKCYTPATTRRLFEPHGWCLAKAEYYDVELIPYPLNRLTPTLAFAAKRRAELAQFGPQRFLANAFVALLTRSH